VLKLHCVTLDWGIHITGSLQLCSRFCEYWNAEIFKHYFWNIRHIYRIKNTFRLTFRNTIIEIMWNVSLFHLLQIVRHRQCRCGAKTTMIKSRFAFNNEWIHQNEGHYLCIHIIAFFHEWINDHLHMIKHMVFSGAVQK